MSNDSRNADRMLFSAVAVVVFAFAIAIFAFVAFGPRPKPEAPEARLLHELRLPTGARDIRDLGNHWHLYTLTIDGRDHRFMFRRAVWPEPETVLEVTSDAKQPSR